MTLVVVASVAGSPGATRLTLGLAAAWPDHARRRIVVEADPDGGRLGAELGVGVEPGLMALALASRTMGLTGDDLVERGAAQVADWYVIPAPASSEQTYSALVHAGGALAAVMAGGNGDPLWAVDAGRLSVRSPALPFAAAADHVVLVTAGSFPALQLVPHRVEALRTAGCAVAVAVVEPTSWPTDEIADFVGADVVAVLPLVKGGRQDGIAAMNGNAWRAWWRTVGDAAGYLHSASRRPVATPDEVAT
jgi:MinD-like ATPase involved in chromosome partitioning or flagellar assembly